MFAGFFFSDFFLKVSSHLHCGRIVDLAGLVFTALICQESESVGSFWVFFFVFFFVCFIKREWTKNKNKHFLMPAQQIRELQQQ